MSTNRVTCSFRKIAAGCAFMLLLAAWACSDDPAETPDASATQDASAETSSNDAQSAAWTPALYRTTDLIIIEPIGLGTVLQGLIRRDINAGILHILVQTANFSADSGDATFEIFGGAGEEVGDSTYQFVDDFPASPGVVSADGSFYNTEPLQINFPTDIINAPNCGTGLCDGDNCLDNTACNDGYECDADGDGQCHQQIVVPLKDVTVSGMFGETGGVLTLRGTAGTGGAMLNGAILKEDADNIEIEPAPGANPISLTALLGEANMDYPEDAATKTGWLLSAEIVTSEVTAAE